MWNLLFKCSFLTFQSFHSRAKHKKWLNFKEFQIIDTRREDRRGKNGDGHLQLFAERDCSVYTGMVMKQEHRQIDDKASHGRPSYTCRHVYTIFIYHLIVTKVFTCLDI